MTRCSRQDLDKQVAKTTSARQAERTAFAACLRARRLTAMEVTMCFFHFFPFFRLSTVANPLGVLQMPLRWFPLKNGWGYPLPHRLDGQPPSS